MHFSQPVSSDYIHPFVAVSLAVCFASGWLLALVLRRCERAGASRARWFVGAALVAGLGTWITQVLAVLGGRPDLPSGFDPVMTALAAIVAVIATGVPMAATAVAQSWQVRFTAGALAGLGGSLMQMVGMSAAANWPLPAPLEAAALGCVTALVVGVARSVAVVRASRALTSFFFVIGTFGAHLLAIAGTVAAGTGEPRAYADHGILAVGTVVVLLLAALIADTVARHSDAQARVHGAQLSTALDHMSNGLVLIGPDGRLGLANRRFAEMFGVNPHKLVPGLTLDAFLNEVGRVEGWAAEKRASIGRRLVSRLAAREPARIEHAFIDGRVFVVESQPVASGGAVLTFDDVTDDRKAQSQIAHMAFHDALTGLPNRRALQERMAEGFQPKFRFKLLLVDLDRFKTINDTFGHAAGDRLLVEVARRTRAFLAPGTFFARIGGDELAVLVPGDSEHAMAVAGDIIAAVTKPFHFDGLALLIGCSIGLCCSDDVQTAEELMQRADLALYEAKRSGRGRAFCYRPGMLADVAERNLLEIDMRMALANRQFHLVYQPIMSLHDGDVIGFEALIRWRHPELGFVAPARFIPIAEESGQIVPIGRWVLEQACAQAITWKQPRTIAVNLSPVQLRAPTIVADITDTLARSGLPPQRLEIELTETALMQDSAAFADVLGTLRALGVRVAMDDFGTGYSSLAHLRSFPLDRIKIDRCFVGTAERDPHSLALLKAVVQIGRDLAIETLAEGVETESELSLLRTIGCDSVQGHLIGRPDLLPSESRLKLPAFAVSSWRKPAEHRDQCTVPNRREKARPAASNR